MGKLLGLLHHHLGDLLSLIADLKLHQAVELVKVEVDGALLESLDILNRCILLAGGHLVGAGAEAATLGAIKRGVASGRGVHREASTESASVTGPLLPASG